MGIAYQVLLSSGSSALESRGERSSCFTRIRFFSQGYRRKGGGYKVEDASYLDGTLGETGTRAHLLLREEGNQEGPKRFFPSSNVIEGLGSSCALREGKGALQGSFEVYFSV